MNVRRCDESGLQAAKAWRDFRIFSWSFCVRWLVAACRSASVLLRTNTVPRFKVPSGRTCCDRMWSLQACKIQQDPCFNNFQFVAIYYIYTIIVV